VALALGLVAVAGALVLAPPDFMKEFESIADTDAGTAGTRRYFWDLSVQMFLERPVFGVGASCWGNALYSGLIEEPLYRAHMTPHSIYFQLITELGAVGTFLWMGCLSAVILGLASLRGARLDADAGRVLAADPDPAVLRKLRADSVFMRNFVPSLAIGIVGYMVCGAFLSVLYYPGFPLFAALVQAAVEAWRNETALAAAVSAPRAPAPAPFRMVPT
jgi:O-antigen ligase